MLKKSTQFGILLVTSAILAMGTTVSVHGQEAAKPAAKSADSNVAGDPDAVAAQAVKTAAVRAEKFTQAASHFGQAIHGLPAGFVDLPKERAAWDAGEKLLAVMISECEDLLKKRKDAVESYTLAAPAFVDARNALLKVKQACDKDAADAKTDRQREDALLWARLCQAAITRNDQNAAAAKDIFQDVQRFSAEAEEDLRNFKKGLQVIRLVRTPLEKATGLADLHARFREYAKRREQAKVAFKALIDKLEKSSYPTPAIPNPPVSKSVIPVAPKEGSQQRKSSRNLLEGGPRLPPRRG